MIRFLDGPAAGVALALARTPLFLRVVQSPGGKWDALDQLSDSPHPRETIHVYRLEALQGFAHMDLRDKAGRRRGVNTAIGSYLFVETPEDHAVRENPKWAAWVAVRAKAEGWTQVLDEQGKPKGWKRP